MYIALIVWLFICSFICFGRHWKSTEKARFNSFFSLFFTACALVMGFRDETVGVDTYNYRMIYESIKYMSFAEIVHGETGRTMEIAYLLFMKLVSSFSGSYYTFQIVYSILFMIGIARFLNKDIHDAFIGATLFLGLGIFLNPFNIQRQMLSVVLIINGVRTAREKKWIATALLWVLAVSFHRTALLFVMGSVLFLIRNKSRLLKLSALLIVIAAINYQRILPWLQQYLPYYRNYYRNTKVHQSAGFVVIIWAIILAESVIVLSVKNVFDGDTKVFAIFSSINILMNIIGFGFNYAERIGLYFQPYSIFLFERFPELFKKKSIRTLYRVGLCSAFLLYFWLSTRTDQYKYRLFF